MCLSVAGGPGPAGWVPLDGDKNVSVVSSWASLVPFPPWCSSVGAADWSAWEIFSTLRGHLPAGGGTAPPPNRRESRRASHKACFAFRDISGEIRLRSGCWVNPSMFASGIQTFTEVIWCVFDLNVDDGNIHKSYSFGILDHFILSLYGV